MSTIIIKYNPYLQTMSLGYRNSETNKEEELKQLNADQKKKINEFANNVILQNRIDDLIDVLKEIYHDDLSLEFIGTSTDFIDLENKAVDMNIKVKKADSPYLLNPDDIKTRIEDTRSLIFSQMNDLISKYPEYTKELVIESNGLEDTLNDRTPVVFIGNGSSGKSSVINALIGEEVFPTGIGTITAAVYEILPTDDIFRVSFKKSNESVSIDFNHDRKQVEKQISESYKNIELPESDNRYDWIYIIISELNSEEPVMEKESVMEIKVEVPFHNLSQCRSKIVLYDTPGPDSETRTGHKEILSTALKRFKKGVCIFVTQPDKIDTATLRGFLSTYLSDSQKTENKKSEEQKRAEEKIIQNIKNVLNINAGIILVNKAEKPIKSLEEEQKNREKDVKELRTNNDLIMEQDRMVYFSSAIALGLSKSQGEEWHSGELQQDCEDKWRRFYNYENKVGYCSLATVALLPQTRKSAICKQYDKAEKMYKENPSEENKMELIANNCGLRAFEYELNFIIDNLAICNMCAQAQKQMGEVLQKIDCAIERINKAINEKKKNYDTEFSDKYKGLEQKLKSLKEEYIYSVNEKFSEMAESGEESSDIQRAIHTIYNNLASEWKTIKVDDLNKEIEKLIKNNFQAIEDGRNRKAKEHYKVLCEGFIEACKEVIETDKDLTPEEKDGFVNCIHSIKFKSVRSPHINSEAVTGRFIWRYKKKRAISEETASKEFTDMASEHWRGVCVSVQNAVRESVDSIFEKFRADEVIRELNPKLREINRKLEETEKVSESFECFKIVMVEKKNENEKVTEFKKKEIKE